MGKYNWTDNQTKAIEARGGDILVSAAAGSGKTAVLTERIIRKLIDPKENAEITDFLIVTFTVSATNELREKLSKAISEAYLENKSQKKLKRQLLNLPHAKIMTIDSFCKFIVNECTKELGLPADMALGDEGELNAIVEDAINTVTEELFNSENYPKFLDTSYLPKEVKRGFLSLIEAFSSSKGYDSLNVAITEVYSALLKFPEPFKRCEHMLEEYDKILRSVYLSQKKLSYFDTEIGKIIIGECREALNVSLSLLEKARSTLDGHFEMAEKYTPAIEQDISLLTKILSNHSPANFLNEISTISFERLKPYSCKNDLEETIANRFKNYRDTAKEIVGVIKKKYPIFDEEKLFMHIAHTFSVSCELFSLIKIIHERIWETKLERKIFSFEDVAQLACRALIKEGSYNHSTREFEKTDYARTLSEKYSEIFIDEYQDVNELQDSIFRAVSNSHNRFMVGDVKQSIYKFRGATPEIFMEYRNNFLPIDEKDNKESPCLISLQNNFRSDSSVINFVNELFEVIMNYNSTDIYRKDDHLVFSKGNDLNLSTEVVILEENAEFEYIADRILEITESEQFSFSDICILARNHNSLAEAKAVFKSRGIPSDYTPNSNFFESYEIATILSILRATDNPTDDISLLSIMTSPIFAFLPKDLMTVRSKAYETDIYFAVVKYAEFGGEEELKRKCNRLIRQLEIWKNMSRNLPSDALIWQIYEGTHLLNIVKNLNDGDARKENLLTFYSISKSYEEKELRGLTKFLYYIENIEKQKRRFGDKEKDENAIHLMTVHNSKGLEFPVCFLCDTSSSISREDEKKKIILSDSFGPAFSISTGKLGGKVITYAKKAAATQARTGSADEELRLLYVALTRAKNKLIITGNTDINKFRSYVETAIVSREALAYSIKNASSILKMIGIGLMANETFKDAISLSNEKKEEFNCGSFKLLMIKNYISDGKINIPTIKMPSSSELHLKKEEIAFAMDNIDKDISVPYKISVSAIREGLLDESDVNGVLSIRKKPEFMSLDSENISAFTGTAMHTFMQFCDFSSCVKNTTVNEAKRLLKYGFLTEEQVNVLNHTSLTAFFKSSIFKEIAASKRVEREKRYTLMLPSSSFFVKNETKEQLDKSNAQTLIQGVIDCYFENEDGSYTIIDFKTDSVRSSDGEEILKKRHGHQLLLYKNAVELIESVKVKNVCIYSFCLGKTIEITEN